MAKTTKYFDTLMKGAKQGILPNMSKDAIEWYRQEAQNIAGVNRSQFIRTPNDIKHTPNKGLEIGSMYFFNYDPKHKATLPVYDTFPLVFPIDIQKDRFLGINLHYLPPKERGLLMDALMTVANNQKYDRTTKLQISYSILKNLTKAPKWQPTIHMYLKSHVKSRTKYIDPSMWNFCLMLPLARFKGKNASQMGSL